MQVLDRIDRAAIAALRERDEYFWLDLSSPGKAEIDAVTEIFGLHPMAAHDIRDPDQRPKLDDYGDYVMLVFYGARSRDGREPELVEVECVISGGFIVTVHAQPCAELEALRPTLDAATRGGEQFVVYRVLDTLTDTFFPVLSAVDDEIDELENAVIERPTDQQLQQIFRLKRTLVMSKIITPQRDLFQSAGEQIIDLPGLEPSARDYFRDVYDHLIRISDLVDSYRDLLTGAMDVYLSTVSNRLNVVMKQLTIIATIFLPLTVVTGFFGQNFGWLVRHITSFWAFAVFGLGGMVVPIVGLMIWFRRSGYLSN